MIREVDWMTQRYRVRASLILTRDAWRVQWAFTRDLNAGQAVRRAAFFLSGLTALLRLTRLELTFLGVTTLLLVAVAAVLAGFLRARTGLTAASFTGACAGAAAVAAAGPSFDTRAGLGSNSNPVVPSGLRTRRAANLRRVRFDTKSRSKSVRPSASNLRICSGCTVCCRITRPERKSQLLPGPTARSHT